MREKPAFLSSPLFVQRRVENLPILSPPRIKVKNRPNRYRPWLENSANPRSGKGAIVGRQFLGEERRKEVEEEESRSERHVGENGKIPRRGVGGVFRRLEKRLYDVVPL